MFKSFASLAALVVTMVLAQTAAARTAGEMYLDACREATAASDQVQRINARYSAERAAFDTGIRDRDNRRAGQAYSNYSKYLSELSRALEVDVWAHYRAVVAAHNYLICLSGKPYTYANNPALKANMNQLREAQVGIQEHRKVIENELRGLWGRFNAARSNRVTLLGQ